MTAHKKATPAGTGMASNTAFTDRHSTAPDPLTGWYALAKNAKAQPVKRNRTQGKQRGQIDGLLANMTFVIVAALLIGGLLHG